MALKPPSKSGLKGFKVRNKSNDVIKASVVIAAGDELDVPEDVARQLVAQSTGFEVGGDLPQQPSLPPEAAEVEEAGGGSARTRSGRRK